MSAHRNRSFAYLVLALVLLLWEQTAQADEPFILMRGVAPKEALETLRRHLFGGAGDGRVTGRAAYGVASKAKVAYLMNLQAPGLPDLSMRQREDIWRDFRMYGNQGAAGEEYQRAFGRPCPGDQLSSAENAFPKARGKVLVYRAPGDTPFVHRPESRATVPCRVVELPSNARLVGVSPTPVGFDNDGLPLFRDGDYSRLADRARPAENLRRRLRKDGEVASFLRRPQEPRTPKERQPGRKWKLLGGGFVVALIGSYEPVQQGFAWAAKNPVVGGLFEIAAWLTPSPGTPHVTWDFKSGIKKVDLVPHPAFACAELAGQSLAECAAFAAFQAREEAYRAYPVLRKTFEPPRILTWDEMEVERSEIRKLFRGKSYPGAEVIIDPRWRMESEKRLEEERLRSERIRRMSGSVFRRLR